MHTFYGLPEPEIDHYCSSLHSYCSFAQESLSHPYKAFQWEHSLVWNLESNPRHSIIPCLLKAGTRRERFYSFFKVYYNFVIPIFPAVKHIFERCCCGWMVSTNLTSKRQRCRRYLSTPNIVCCWLTWLTVIKWTRTFSIGFCQLIQFTVLFQ